MKDINFEKIGKKLRETRISKGLTRSEERRVGKECM